MFFLRKIQLFMPALYIQRNKEMGQRRRTMTRTRKRPKRGRGGKMPHTRKMKYRRRKTARRTYKLQTAHKKRKRTSKMRKIQHGGNFNREQIELIEKALRNHRSTEPFTDEQIDEYVKKLNDVSQVILRGDDDNFDHFYNYMLEQLSGEHPGTFKEYVDGMYEDAVNDVETDVEEEPFYMRENIGDQSDEDL